MSGPVGLAQLWCQLSLIISIGKPIFAPVDTDTVKDIPVYHELNDIHQATNSPLRTQNRTFHCFQMSDVNLGLRSLPPYRSDFFTLALSFGSTGFNISVNDTAFSNLERFLICVAPGQLSSFQKEGDWMGYCTFFKAEFIQYKSELNFLEDYPFFTIEETNLFPITEEQFHNLSLNYQQILLEQGKAAPYAIEIIRSSFQAILWQVRRIYESIIERRSSDKAGLIIASKFQYLVNQFFRRNVLVEDYAEMLHITPNHLSQTIKETTGKTAKRIISQRRVEEAKFLLKYTHTDVAQIAHHLHFSEPTHFNEFFKKECGYTPLSYRKLHQQQALSKW
jgi:AraC family transcriptional regulator, transcriptional activator of pobA